MDIEQPNKNKAQQNQNQQQNQMDYMVFNHKASQVNNQPVFEVKIKNSQYKFDFNDKITFEYLQNNEKFINIIYNLEDIQQFYKKKQSTKIKSIAEVTGDHCYFTAIESYFDHISALIEFIKRDPEKNKNATSAPENEIDKCCICMDELFENIYNYDIQTIIGLMENKQSNITENKDVIQMPRCLGQHGFHINCLLQMLKNQKNVGFLQCPVCQQIYGILKGNQPEGTMTFQVNKNLHCSGYEKVGTIVINYNIYGHKPGTSRVAYLPDNKEGQEVLKLLQIAFERKLIFTIGTSVTTGMQNQVVWNGIHHKTNTTGGSSYFGYPDPTYFNRVKQELGAKGVF